MQLLSSKLTSDYFVEDVGPNEFVAVHFCSMHDDRTSPSWTPSEDPNVKYLHSKWTGNVEGGHNAPLLRLP